MPAMFALGDKVIGNPVMSYFIAFGSFAMFLLVDFSGSRIDRARSQTLLGIACAVMICLGTLASRIDRAGRDRHVRPGLRVLFSGVVSSVIASATTPLLLAFILPVRLPGPHRRSPSGLPAGGSRRPCR